MTIRTNTPSVLDNPPIPVQAKLTAAWTSFMFFYIYVDYLHLYKGAAGIRQRRAARGGSSLLTWCFNPV
ncbi:hypothetical protein [Nonomuraea sp. NPDC003709]|uniref:hypothetical protein n=1 Tax=Nonomuraea sp. NPDC003709 TaxID=3154450 RepID=UPI0033B4A1EA